MTTHRRRWLGVRGAVLAVVVLTLHLPASAATPVGTIDRWTSDLDVPSGITQGPDGSMWFTNFAGGSVGRITSAGEIDLFRDANRIDEPTDIVTGPDGNLWFTDFGNRNGVVRITTDGTITSYPGTGLQTRSITVGPDGNLWFISRSESIGRITTEGAVTFFDDPSLIGTSDIAAGPDGNLWFTNAGRRDFDPFPQTVRVGASIGRLTTDGEFTFFTSPRLDGVSPELEAPESIVAGPDGDLWFATQNNAVATITTDGTLGARTDVIVDQLVTGTDGTVWGHSRSAVFSITPAREVTSIPVPSFVNDMAFGPDGNIWIVGSALGGQLWRVTPTGQATLIDTVVTQASAAAVGTDGNLWFTNSQSIGRLTRSGEATIETASWVRQANHLTEGPGDVLWFSTDRGFGTVATDGTLTEYPWNLPFAGVTGLTLGGDGNMWFSFSGSGGGIGRIAPDGTITEFGPLLGYSALNVVTAPDGTVWFLDRTSAYTGHVGTIAPDGSTTSFPVSIGGTDMLIGPDGNVWWATDGGVGRVTPDGAVTEFDGGGPPGIDDLAIGPDGAVWFAGESGNVLGRVSILGDLTIVPGVGGPVSLGTGADGSLWVSSDDERLAQVTPAGDLTWFFPRMTARSIVPTGDGGLWLAGNTHDTDQIARVEVLPEDQISSTLHLSADDCRVLQLFADALDTDGVGPIAAFGVDLALRLVEQSPSSSRELLAPDSDSPAPAALPCPVTITFPGPEEARLRAAASTLELSFDQFTSAGGHLITEILRALVRVSG